MEDIGFEEQLKQEEIQKLKEEESRDKTYKDKDGTEYEWDEAKKAWFPKVIILYNKYIVDIYFP